MNNKLLEKSSGLVQRLKIAAWVTLGTLLIVLGLASWMSSTEKREVASGDLISQRGIHWHPEVTIYVKGVKQEIPANIGLTGTEMGVHTHDGTGVIHLELQGIVRKNDTVLEQFFKNWGKDFRSFGSTVKMTVNGKENTELENYAMKDEDKIDLRYE